jgi:predicted GH43/DUF377 family glycosyl hydrolase
MIGPFVDYELNPILVPGQGFASQQIFNPTVIVEGDTFYMLYRAKAGDSISGRIGLAISSDGVNFILHSAPIIVPEHEYEKLGCEDPRITKLGDTYYLTYQGSVEQYEVCTICLATSKDLCHWEKHRPALKVEPGRWDSGQIKAGGICPGKINGKYVMYITGEEKRWEPAIGIAYSNDLLHWQEWENNPILLPREGFFDSKGLEVGAAPVITEEGILLIYNGWGKDDLYKPGAALFSKENPDKVLWRSEEPILILSKDWGKEFGGVNQIVAEGLVKHDGYWWLYYGAAEIAVCLARCKAKG